MTFADIYNEAINLRFNGNATKLAQVKKWVNQAEIALWNSADWTFRRVPAVAIAVAGGAATEPSDFGKAIRLYDPRGFEVPYARPDRFEENWVAPVPAPTGNVQAYTVIDRQILVGPPEDGTYKLAYRRRYTKRNNVGAAAQGVMSADLDTPYWDSEHHYILVPWAIRMGKYLEDDPSGSLTEQLLVALGEKSMFQAMFEELALRGVEQQTETWGGGFC